MVFTVGTDVQTLRFLGIYDDDVLGGVAKTESEAVAVGRVCLCVVYCWRRAQGTCLLQVRQLEPSSES